MRRLSCPPATPRPPGGAWRGVVRGFGLPPGCETWVFDCGVPEKCGLGPTQPTNLPQPGLPADHPEPANPASRSRAKICMRMTPPSMTWTPFWRGANPAHAWSRRWSRWAGAARPPAPSQGSSCPSPAGLRAGSRGGTGSRARSTCGRSDAKAVHLLSSTRKDKDKSRTRAKVHR